MANSDPLEIRLVDPDLLTTHGILPLMRADYYVQLNEPGSGNFEISTGSGLSSSVESDAFADVFYRGSSRGGFLIENISRAHANSSEGGGRTVTASGRGSLALLEDAIVWDDGTGSTERTFNGTQAATLITLMQEAQNRGGLQNIIWDFSATDDTDSVAWTDDEDLALTVGTSLLDVIRQISDTGIDFDISRSGNEFTLHAYKNGAGSNKSTTVYFRVGQNCEEVSSDEVGGDIRNVLKTKYEGGYTTVSNSASISARRRREGLLDARYAQTTTTARTFAAAHLDTKKDPKHQISIQVYDGVGPRVFVDYELGDTITLDIDGTETEYRIRGMHLHWDNSEYASVTLTMNDDVMENEIRLTREFNRLKTDFTSARDADLLDVSFWAAIGDPNISYGVYKLLIVGNTLYVANGYSLLSYDIDGGGWTRVVTAANIINSIAAIGSDLYLCGSNKIYKYSGGTLTTVGTAIYTPESSATAVLSMVAIGTDLFVGGIFDSIEGVSINGIAKYNGSWSDIGGTGYVGAINAMDTDGSNLFAGLSGYVKKWNGSSWTTLGSSFAPSAVLSVAVYQTDLLAGTASNIYIWDGAAWSVLGGGVSGAVWAITTYLSDVYVGGAFTDRGNYIARFSGDEWIELEEGTNNLVKSLVMYNEDLYVAGTFTQAGDKSAQGIAAYFTNFSSFANYIEHAPGEFNLGEAIHNATAKTSLTGDDEIPLWDSISQALRKITWTNIIASIKTWADTIYVSLTGNQTIAGVKTFSSDPLIPDEAYDATAWNGSLEPPTKNAVRDKIESMGGGGTPGGSDTQVQYNNGGAFGGDAEFTWDDVTKALGIGDSADLPSISPDHTFWMTGDGVSPSQFMVGYGSAIAPFHTFMKSDGSVATPANVKDDQVIGRIRGRGYDGTGWTDTRLEIRFIADGDWGTNDTPTRIELWTCPDGSGTLTLAMTIGSDGNVNIASGKTYNINGSPHSHTGLVTNGDSHDHNGGDGAQISHVNLSGIGTLTHENLDLAVPLPVKNTSGATANANDVGYLIYVAGSGYEYKTTTTSTADLPACVVLVGGANNANVYVVNRGRFTIPYAGTAPSQGDFLVFSTTAGKVSKQATMRPEIIAVAMAAGSGGTVDALLLTQTKYVPYLSSNYLYYCSAHSETTWTGTINGAPGATSVTYTTATGQKDVLTPQSTSELAKLLVYNVTRGTYRLVTANNTGTNTLTTISSTDAWANGDSLTISDPVIGYSSTPKIVGMDLSQQTEIPLLARAIVINEWSSDSTANKLSSYHPYETYSVAKLINSVNSQVANIANIDNVTIPLIQQRFGKFTQASGTGTRLTLIKISGYHLATP